MTTNILEHTKVSPPRDTARELSLPILFFDMVWYDFAADPIVFFFGFPSCSKSHFLDTIVPDLKTSLSLTLAQFSPYAGKIIHPLTNPDINKPVLRYESGDSVSFTVSESSADLNHLTGNHPRPCDEFYAFAPRLPPATRTENSICCPVLAIQVTLFPGQGICIGFVIHHAISDASTFACFIQAWALVNNSTCKLDDDYKIIRDRLAEANCLPSYDRKSVTNIGGLDSLYWDLIVKSSSYPEPPPLELPMNKFRSSFFVKKDEIQKLKDQVSDFRVSSFTAICALVWVCSAMSAGDDANDEEPEYLCFSADCRGRLKPPLPANYFGNCVALVKAELKHGQVKKGRDGFVMAVKAIGEAIKESVLSENGILHGAENWPEEYGKLIGKCCYGVAGSPRFDYAVDFGWGPPTQYEALFIDGGSIWLSKSKDHDGDLEIVVSKPMVEMDAFAAVFRDLLADMLQQY